MSAMYCDNTNTILGNSIDVNLCNIEDSEIRADVVVKQVNTKRLWGQIVDCEGMPMANALVKLIRVICHEDTVSYEGVAHTIADYQGFYQFDVCADDRSCYKILVNKSVTGGETVIDRRESACNPCACDYERKAYSYRSCHMEEMNTPPYPNNNRMHNQRYVEPPRRSQVPTCKVNRPPHHQCDRY